MQALLPLLCRGVEHANAQQFFDELRKAWKFLNGSGGEEREEI
jgi:hypothetical protein